MTLLTRVLLVAVLTGCSGGASPTDVDTDTDADTDVDTRLDNEDVVLTTRLGTISIDLFDDEVPLNAANFRSYFDSGFYDGGDGGQATIVHHIESPLWFEAGLYQPDLANKPVGEPVENESAIAPSNRRGTVAALKQTGRETATAGWLINASDNTYRDGDGDGWTVFGEVVRGMDVVDAIMAESTESRGGFEKLPAEPVTIQSVTVY